MLRELKRVCQRICHSIPPNLNAAHADMKRCTTQRVNGLQQNYRRIPANEQALRWQIRLHQINPAIDRCEP
ncbi:hypothetical protein [Ralstonia pickettii]|jgi:hypothetical protein|uniref:hypothetical protein n=2 Tax=Pseudomonadota TaxID=1224 RepID=UPI0015FE6671|nr:hypothetical protein [Ralstonia pickettii]MBX4003877.1 hypothetical protein [Ralstonia pickettii]MBX4030558.1 hypothetical protein [Ralstonia pickettii]MBX4072313.1 hypothetical protein [Ralstonia pickettii]MBX4077433.1 hypothetical protein [Ralstonia pickettii]MBX4090237.1 hypothetical protein [Ralstonia pickettii]